MASGTRWALTWEELPDLAPQEMHSRGPCRWHGLWGWTPVPRKNICIWLEKLPRLVVQSVACRALFPMGRWARVRRKLDWLRSDKQLGMELPILHFESPAKLWVRHGRICKVGNWLRFKSSLKARHHKRSCLGVSSWSLLRYWIRREPKNKANITTTHYSRTVALSQVIA